MGWGGAQAYAKAKGLLLDNRPALDALAKLLMEKETVPAPARLTTTPYPPDHPTPTPPHPPPDGARPSTPHHTTPHQSRPRHNFPHAV